MTRHRPFNVPSERLLSEKCRGDKTVIEFLCEIIKMLQGAEVSLCNLNPKEPS